MQKTRYKHTGAVVHSCAFQKQYLTLVRRISTLQKYSEITGLVGLRHRMGLTNAAA